MGCKNQTWTDWKLLKLKKLHTAHWPRDRLAAMLAGCTLAGAGPSRAFIAGHPRLFGVIPSPIQVHYVERSRTGAPPEIIICGCVRRTISHRQRSRQNSDDKASLVHTSAVNGSLVFAALLYQGALGSPSRSVRAKKWIRSGELLLVETYLWTRCGTTTSPLYDLQTWSISRKFLAWRDKTELARNRRGRSVLKFKSYFFHFRQSAPANSTLDTARCACTSTTTATVPSARCTSSTSTENNNLPPRHLYITLHYITPWIPQGDRRSIGHMHTILDDYRGRQ